jgi:hypothetical protein
MKNMNIIWTEKEKNYENKQHFVENKPEVVKHVLKI